jgi:hypothetical protein
MTPNRSVKTRAWRCCNPEGCSFSRATPRRKNKRRFSSVEITCHNLQKRLSVTCSRIQFRELWWSLPWSQPLRCCKRKDTTPTSRCSSGRSLMMTRFVVDPFHPPSGNATCCPEIPFSDVVVRFATLDRTAASRSGLGYTSQPEFHLLMAAADSTATVVKGSTTESENHGPVLRRIGIIASATPGG